MIDMGIIERIDT